MATFGDIAKGFDYGMNAAAKSFDGNNKYIRITDIDEVSSQYLYDDVVSPDGELEDRYLVKENDILLARTGASTGKSYLYRNSDGKLYFAGFLIRANIYKHNSYFVFSQLHTLRYKKWISVMSARSGQPGINSQEYASFPVYTTSLQEEDKIATFLKLLDERIITQNKIIERYESLIRGINQYAFTNTGINYKLGEICEIRSGYSGNQLTLKNGLKVSRIETISGHKVNMERVGYVAPFESSENYRLQIGDILFSNINSVEYIGNTAFIDKDYNLYHGMNLLRLIPKKELVMPFYLYLVLNTNRLLNHFKTVCNKAVSQASINQTELGKTIVRIPNLMNQNRICELFQTLYTKLEAERYFISLLQDQKQHLLRQMFI
ncbi:restriction endonuclease subunit S [Bacteroides sp. AF32-8BH]|uniref:restriction endonuclease subunit S n=1 Tax=Bacteroides sp. AF32-8BH TaxID=2302925 RepID=UPI0011C0CB2C|nr:restriction endonuclease subunit S [Bacteroides sp. AF32-8BH]